MELDASEGMETSQSIIILRALANSHTAPQDAPQDQQAEGLSPCISWSLPRSLYADSAESPPETPTEKQKQQSEEDIFFNLLGVSSDLVGFDVGGHLRLAFDR
jgi:hypothetical protein